MEPLLFSGPMICIREAKKKRENRREKKTVDNIKVANLLNIIISAKNKKNPDPAVVNAPLKIEIPKSLKATFIFLCLSGYTEST